MKTGNCIHWTGVQNDCCKLGINYQELVGGNRDGMAFKLPCLTLSTSHIEDAKVSCDKYQEPTAAQIDEENAEFEAVMDRMKKVMPVVAEWRKKSPIGKQEVIECPACQGRLHLSQAACNGHVWGKCETEGCVSWME